MESKLIRSESMGDIDRLVVIDLEKLIKLKDYAKKLILKFNIEISDNQSLEDPSLSFRIKSHLNVNTKDLEIQETMLCYDYPNFLKVNESYLVLITNNSKSFQNSFPRPNSNITENQIVFFNGLGPNSSKDQFKRPENSKFAAIWVPETILYADNEVSAFSLLILLQKYCGLIKSHGKALKSCH